MTLEKNRYSVAMDKLHVTPEERERFADYLFRAYQNIQQRQGEARP